MLSYRGHQLRPGRALHPHHRNLVARFRCLCVFSPDDQRICRGDHRQQRGVLVGDRGDREAPPRDGKAGAQEVAAHVVGAERRREHRRLGNRQHIGPTQYRPDKRRQEHQAGDQRRYRIAGQAEGVEPGFWKIAMRPGKPLMHGRAGRVHALGLPGNPVSTLVTGLMFLAPLVRAMLGRADVLPTPETAVLTAPLRANDMRRDFLRARLAVEAGRLAVTPVANQDSSLLSMIAAANALIIRPEHAPEATAGDEVEILRI